MKMAFSFPVSIILAVTVTSTLGFNSPQRNFLSSVLGRKSYGDQWMTPERYDGSWAGANQRVGANQDAYDQEYHAQVDYKRRPAKYQPDFYRQADSHRQPDSYPQLDHYVQPNSYSQADSDRQANSQRQPDYYPQADSYRQRDSYPQADSYVKLSSYNQLTSYPQRSRSPQVDTNVRSNVVTEVTLKPCRDYLVGQLQKTPRLIGKYVRIGFHNCLNNDGCVGCLNMTDVHNTGLRAAYAELKSWYDQNSPVISFADFVALAATEAVNVGISNARCNGQPCTHRVHFKYGRQTCSDPNNPPKGKFTDADKLGGLSAIESCFRFTRAEAVALLGFHAIGRCTFADSGFDGAWDNTPNAADNGYFMHLSNDSFAVNKTTARLQWNNAEHHLFLQSDMEGRYVVTMGSDGKPSCSTNIRNCPLSSTASLVDRYATGGAQVWLDDAVPVFTRMIETSHFDLKVVPSY